MSARWVCKMCDSHGLGGPAGWERHKRARHTDGNRYGSVLSFGFAPNFTAYQRGGSRQAWQRPATASGEGVAE